MVEISSIDPHGNNKDNFWKGVDHNITIVKLCLNYILHDLTSDIPERETNNQQSDGAAKENILNVKKKRL